MIQSTTEELALSKILVIDDDEIDRVTLRRYLGAAGIASIIDELPDGHDVVARVLENRYDCIVLDHFLPTENGFDVIERIRAAGIETPILCVAGQDEDVGAALVAAGATDFLPKSDLSPSRLARRLRYALRLGRAERQANRIRAELDAHRRLLNAVVSQLPTGVAVVDARLEQVLIVNQRAEQVLADNGKELVRPDAVGLAAQARKCMADAFAAGTTTTCDQTASAGERLFRVSASPVLDGAGAVTAGVIVLDDITEETRARTASERAAFSQKQVLAIVSHDLRGPLSAINVALDGLGDDTVVGSDRQRYVASVQRSVERANRLIKDLLTADQIEAGNLRVERQPVQIKSLLEQAARDHELVAKQAGMSISTVVEPGASQILADREHLLQALANLITNSLRHARGSGPIELTARAADAQVELVVRDHGPGIPEAAWPHIFDRYWQGRVRRGGAGLGLSIVRGIAQSHGGEVAVTSTDGGGATFVMTMPALQPGA